MAKKLKPLVIVLLALGLAYWFARGIDWTTVGEHWRKANLWLLLIGSLLINATLILRAVRWIWFLKPITKANFWDALAATVIGFGCIFLLGRAGDVVRPLMLSLRTRIKASATIATILIERVFDMTAVGALFAVNLLFIELPPNSSISMDKLRVTGILMVCAMILGIGLLVLLRLRAQFVLGLFEKLFGWLPKKILDFGLGLLTHLADGLGVLMNARALLATVGHTVLIWGTIALSYWFVVRGFGLEFSPSQIVFVLGAGLVGSLIPTPGGSAGAFHVAAQKGFIALDVEQNLAASIAIAVHFISFGSPFVWAIFYLLRTDISLGQIRTMMSGQESGDKLPEVATVNE